jgi:hypothetical protein
MYIIIIMYNSKIKSYIDKYRQINQDTPHFKDKNRTWSKECYNRMKIENGARYMDKKEVNRIRYWNNLKSKDLEKYKKAIIKLQEKDEDFYNKVIQKQNLS